MRSLLATTALVRWLQSVALLRANPGTRLFSFTTECNNIQVYRGDGGGDSSRGKESQTEADPFTATVRGAKAVALRAGTVVVRIGPGCYIIAVG